MISEWWEGFSSHLRVFIDGNPCSVNCMLEWRGALEHLRGDSPQSDCVVASMKLAIDAFILATLNPYALLLESRDSAHNDLDPLIRKAVMVLAGARDGNDDFDRGVTYDPSVDEQFDAINSKRQLEGLIRNAVRPGPGSGMT